LDDVFEKVSLSLLDAYTHGSFFRLHVTVWQGFSSADTTSTDSVIDGRPHFNCQRHIARTSLVHLRQKII